MPPLVPAPLNTCLDLYHTFSDFLTVATHTILYERAIYPDATFITARKYNFPVRQNRHPKVCKWIQDAVAAVEQQMIKGTVARVAVVIMSSDNDVMERFMFDVERFPVVPKEELLTEFEAKEGEFGISIVDVEEQLRATIRKLAYCGSKLKDLPEDCTYTIAVELKESAEPPLGHPQPWEPSEPSLQTGEKRSSERIGADLGGVKSIPVRAVEAGEFILEAWIEEGHAKQHRV